MRALALAVLLLLLAGCAGPASVQQQDETGGEEGGDGRRAGGRSSEDAGGEGDDPPHDTVTVLDAPLAITSAGSQSFDVDIPINATVAEWSFGWTTPVFMADSLTFALDGCGSVVHSGLTGSFGGSGGMIEGRICKDADSGAHVLTVSNGPTGFLDGVVRLKVHIPTGNTTASA